jgi:hypothetical protein
LKDRYLIENYSIKFIYIVDILKIFLKISNDYLITII